MQSFCRLSKSKDWQEVRWWLLVTEKLPGKSAAIIGWDYSRCVDLLGWGSLIRYLVNVHNQHKTEGNATYESLTPPGLCRWRNSNLCNMLPQLRKFQFEFLTARVERGQVEESIAADYRDASLEAFVAVSVILKCHLLQPTESMWAAGSIPAFIGYGMMV